MESTLARALYVAIAITSITFAAYYLFFTSGHQLSNLEQAALEMFFLGSLFSVYLFIFMWDQLPCRWYEVGLLFILPFSVALNPGSRVEQLGDYVAVFAMQFMSVPMSFVVFIIFGQFFGKLRNTMSFQEKLFATVVMTLIYGIFGIILAVAGFALYNYYIWEGSLNSINDYLSVLVVSVNTVIMARHFNPRHLLDVGGIKQH